jgi:o-succinylbenzoate synthase
MNIHSVKLSVIKMPLKKPFVTHLETVTEREAIIVEVNGHDGFQGYGEGVAFSSPWYTEETVKTSYHMLTDFLIPRLQKASICHPSEVYSLFDVYRKNHMAKAAIESALWDLHAKREGVPLTKILGGVGNKIPSGVVVATSSVNLAIREIEDYLEKGYRRVKIKISPENDIQFVSELRRRFPHLELMADANSAYTLKDINRLKALDEFGLLMIEQPLGYDDIVDHSVVQKQISTPICLDESIVNFEDARRAVELGSCRVINIKVGRVGGIAQAVNIHDYCRDNGIDVWCGGMIEFGISRGHNIALASLPGFTIPGDISGSDRYWEKDIILPEVEVKNGQIQISEQPGIGVELNRQRLNEVTVSNEVISFS